MKLLNHFLVGLFMIGINDAQPANSNTQSKVQQSGGDNSNEQSGIQQTSGRRATTGASSLDDEASTLVKKACPPFDRVCLNDSEKRRANSNVQSGVQQMGSGNSNEQSSVQQFGPSRRAITNSVGLDDESASLVKRACPPFDRVCLNDSDKRRANSNVQSGVQQFGGSNSNEQSSVQQFGPSRRANSNVQSGVQQIGSQNSNEQSSVQQFGSSRRANSNVQSGIQQMGSGNSNAQKNIQQLSGRGGEPSSLDDESANLVKRACPPFDRVCLNDSEKRRANSNMQSGIQQYGGSNSNEQSSVQQFGSRRANSNVQSGVQQMGSGNSNAQKNIQQLGQSRRANSNSMGLDDESASLVKRACPPFDRVCLNDSQNRRANSNMQSGIQQYGSSNSNEQSGIQQYGSRRFESSRVNPVCPPWIDSPTCAAMQRSLQNERRRTNSNAQMEVQQYDPANYPGPLDGFGTETSLVVGRPTPARIPDFISLPAYEQLSPYPQLSSAQQNQITGDVWATSQLDIERQIQDLGLGGVGGGYGSQYQGSGRQSQQPYGGAAGRGQNQQAYGGGNQYQQPYGSSSQYQQGYGQGSQSQSPYSQNQLFG